MKPEQVKAELGGLPHMSLIQGRKLWEFLQEHALKDCLELGFFHGTSSAYLAAALDEMGEGSLTCIDLEYTRGLEPSIEQVLERCGLRRHVQCYYEPTSYVWRLMRFLEKDPTPRFDFCYLDGAHTWFDDGFSFLLVDRLLRPGGWIVFDDLDWTYGDYLGGLSEHQLESLGKTLPAEIVGFMRRMPDEMRRTPQIRKVYELLVKTHPGFDEFRDEGGWAWARKSPHALHAAPVRREVVAGSGRPGGWTRKLSSRLRRRFG